MDDGTELMEDALCIDLHVEPHILDLLDDTESEDEGKGEAEDAMVVDGEPEGDKGAGSKDADIVIDEVWREGEDGGASELGNQGEGGRVMVSEVSNALQSFWGDTTDQDLNGDLGPSLE